MPDTAILPSHWLSEGPNVSENDLRHWMEDISKDLKESIAQQARHSQESAVYRASNDARVKNIEDHMEKRSAFKSGLTMAGIGAFFGALAAAIGKKTGLWTLALAALLVGCGTPESVKETNYLDGKAAHWIAGVTDQPEVKRAALTIEAGSDQIGRKLGEPETKPEYTPETHEKIVAQAKDDIDRQESVKSAITGWFQNAVTKVADLVLPGLGGALLGAFFWLRKKLSFDALKAGTAPIVKVIDDHPDIAKKVMDYSSGIGLGGPVKAAVDFLKKKP